MNSILQIACLFLIQMAFGSALILPFFPLQVAGKSFVRFYYGFIVIFSALFLFCALRMNLAVKNYYLITAVAAWIWALSFTKSFLGMERLLHKLFAVCSLVFLFLFPLRTIFHGVSFTNYLVPFLLFLSATIFLSFHMMNMIFGHWYLVNKELPISYLIKSCRALIFVTYGRIATVGISTYWAYKMLEGDAFTRLIDFSGHGIFFWARVLAGLGIPLLVSHLAYESAKIKSTQSATGILYAGTVFVLMGEIMALYLLSLTGIVF